MDKPVGSQAQKINGSLASSLCGARRTRDGGSNRRWAVPLGRRFAKRTRRFYAGLALYRRHRLGRNGRQFTLLSFRTTSGGRSARETRIGEFLQYTWIVDLPQLLNVLRGDITLVGRIPTARRVVKWTAWAILALLSGALFRGAGLVLEFLE